MDEYGPFDSREMLDAFMRDREFDEVAHIVERVGDNWFVGIWL